MNDAATPAPEPILPVTVRRHRVDWEADDLAEVTARRAMSLGSKLQRGSWYLSPRFTVSCPAPTAAFFRTVLELRSSWLRTCRQVLGNHGQRSEARRVERAGRLACSLVFNQPGEAPSPPRSRSGSSRVVLTVSRRREVVQAGRTAKNLAFSGILFVEGEQLPPRTWQARYAGLRAGDHANPREKRAGEGSTRG